MGGVSEDGFPNVTYDTHKFLELEGMGPSPRVRKPMEKNTGNPGYRHNK